MARLLLNLCTLSAICTSALALPVQHGLQSRATLNPILGGQNFPDPGVIRTGQGWYAFSTNSPFNGKTVYIQKAFTPDWKNWQFTPGDDALPRLPSWVDMGNPRVWAPDPVQLNDGSFIMYYTAALKSNTRFHCLSYAKSRTVTGPYVDASTQPFICPLAQGGAIDPAGYFDPKDGTRWITYKIDGNAIGHGGECGNTVAPIVPTPILLQQVAQDGFTKIGNPVQILTNGPSDGPYVEAPSLTKLNGKYVLFFSPQCYTSDKYRVEYATADSIKGPYTRRGQLLATGRDGLMAPGGLDVAINGDHVIWHGDFGNGRASYTGILTMNGNTVTVRY
ncbi:hypothetical protein WHR41_02029 [Cladosporium halotolerans]|uniref:Glycoside hydrolase family 43 protein n=1 Tax=Cladosporium halotolerans TaxID=1052096 RepID=A0AB34KW60_9PEZI